jgi:hypothetical protein
MAKVALAEEPFEIAVARGSDMLAAQRWPLVPVSLGVGFVAGLAVIAVENSARRDRIGPVRHGIGPEVLSEGDVVPKGTGQGPRRGTRTHRRQNRDD